MNQSGVNFVSIIASGCIPVIFSRMNWVGVRVGGAMRTWQAETVAAGVWACGSGVGADDVVGSSSVVLLLTVAVERIGSASMSSVRWLADGCLANDYRIMLALNHQLE